MDVTSCKCRYETLFDGGDAGRFDLYVTLADVCMKATHALISVHLDESPADLEEEMIEAIVDTVSAAGSPNKTPSTTECDMDIDKDPVAPPENHVGALHKAGAPSNGPEVSASFADASTPKARKA